MAKPAFDGNRMAKATGALRAQKRRRQEKWLEQYPKHRYRIKDTCEAAGISYHTYKNWKSTDDWFAERVRKADLDRLKEDPQRDIDIDRGSLLRFSEWRFRYLGVSNDEGHNRITDAISRAKAGRITVILAPPESGKDLHHSTPILAYSGEMLHQDTPVASHRPSWMTMGDLKIGDYVYGRNGLPARVIKVIQQQNRPMRRLRFSDGSSIVCDTDHKWFVRDRNRGKKWEGVYTAAEIEQRMDSRGPRPTISIPMPEPLQMPEAELPIDPWLLGYWLGNGSKGLGQITTHGGDADWIESRLRGLGYEMSRRDNESNSTTINPYGLSTELRLLGVRGRKHIPDAYMLSSESQRRALLAGLLDSDGHAGGGNKIELCFTDKQLSVDAYHLIRSLGIKANVYEGEAAYYLDGEKHVTGTRYRILWVAEGEHFTSPRKSKWEEKKGQGERLRWKYITSVEEMPDDDGVCISVDNEDHLFVAGDDFTVTHNSTTMEDYMTFRICLDPNIRITYVHQSDSFVKDVVGRIQNRFTDEENFHPLIGKYGPFKGDGEWSAHGLTVAKKNSDERGNTLRGRSIYSRAQGIRTDLLLIDDIQDISTIGQTDRILSVLRQTFFTRAVKDAPVVMVGNRVDLGDVWEAILEDPGLAEILDVIIVPALENGESLFPSINDEQQWATKRRIVGDDVWFRNYMQTPKLSGEGTFRVDDLLAALTRDRRAGTLDKWNGRGVLTGIDPALGGGNAVVTCVWGDDFIAPIDVTFKTGLQRNEEIYAILAEHAARYSPQEAVWEIASLQRGMARDERVEEMGREYGFRITEHETSGKKMDPTIGIGGMAGSFIRGEVIIPADLERPERPAPVIETLWDQLLTWRPDIPTRLLRQDAVMAFWFCWVRWRELRRHGKADADSWRAAPMPAAGPRILSGARR